MKYSKQRAQARRAAKARGHRMGRFHEFGVGVVAICRDCECTAVVRDEGTEPTGVALAYECRGGRWSGK